MSIVSQTIDNLLGGVSQLPDHQRESSKLTEQINAYSHRSNGLMKRPGSQHVALLTDEITGWDRAFLHVIDRDSGERYYLFLVDGDIRLFDALTGDVLPISFPQGLALFQVPDAELIADFTQPNAGEGIWWDGSTFTVPSGLNTYRYGPSGQYQFVTPPSGLQITASELGIYFNRVAVQGVSPPGPPPDQYGASLAYCTSTYPVPNPDVIVAMNVGHSLIGTTQPGGVSAIANWSRKFWLSARQEGAANAQGRRYVLACVERPNDMYRWEIGLTSGTDLFYTTVGASGPDLPIADMPDLPSKNLVKFVVRTEANGDVTLIGYHNGVEVISRNHAFSTGQTIATTGWAGFFVQGDGLINPPSNTPQGPPDPVVPRGYTVVDNFTIASGRTMAEALPFGIGPMYKCLTVGDRTYICNTLLNVKQSPDTTPAPTKKEALIYVRQADYSTTYTVIVQVMTGPIEDQFFDATIGKSFTTTDGSTPASRASITTENVAEQLKVALAADATLSSKGFTFTRTGSVIYVERDSTVDDFNIICRDGMADDGLISIQGSVQRFEDLPTQCRHGIVLEVKGDPGSEFDNYFVQYEELGASTGTGVGTWKECPKPDEEYRLDGDTMPWVLEREPNGGWSCQPGAWLDRVCGSLLTNPLPSFVGHPIKEMFWEDGRLGFCSNGGIILSETGKPYNFFRKSAKALYDSDVIDVKAAFSKSMEWQNARHWDDKLMLWANTAQGALEHNGPLTPRSIAFSLLTSVENRPSVAPFVVGDRIFYHAQINGQTRIGEYFVPQFTGKNKSADATSEVPSYIKGIPVGIAGSEQPGFLAVITSEDRDTVFVHSYLWAADTKVQSSWSKWTMPSGSTVIAVDFYWGRLALTVVRSDGVYLEYLDLGSLDEPTATSPVLIDRQIASTDASVTAVFDTGETEWTVPYTQASGLVVVRISDGAVIPTTQLDSNTVRTTGGAGDLTAVPVLIGVSYTRSLTLSRIYRRRVRNGKETTDTEGRLRLGYLTFVCDGAGAVSVAVTPSGRSAYNYTRAAQTRFKVPVQTKNDCSIVVTDTSVLSCAISSLEWEGTISSRTQKL